ncbi:MAG: transcription antitermination factor NusB, partial [Alloscardovia omnicolens]|nr:transcription antitermination factor NusB [Alloscardovia omnicolens]
MNKRASSHNKVQHTARSVAYSVLSRLEEKDAYANLLLPQVLDESGLSNADKAFVTDVVYGTLRWRLLLDRVIEAA